MIFKTPLFRSLFSLIVVIAILHITAINFYLYWDFWWLDLIIHFLGGFWIALLVLWFISFSGYSAYRPRFYGYDITWALSILASLGIAILWEVFEFQTGITVMSSRYWGDTLSDIFMGLTGGSVASLYVYKRYKQLLEN